MTPVLGRWLTTDRVEVIVWGREPARGRHWHAISIDGRRLAYSHDDGVEVHERTGALLVRIDMGTDPPWWWSKGSYGAPRKSAIHSRS